MDARGRRKIRNLRVAARAAPTGTCSVSARKRDTRQAARGCGLCGNYPLPRAAATFAVTARPHNPGMVETDRDRLNRELLELLNELRVALPGVQVLVAFLLAIPFARGFATTTRFERNLYFGALASALIATVLLMAPSAYHRVLFRHHDKELLIRHANRLAIAGIFSLGVSLTINLYFVCRYVFGGGPAAIATLAFIALIALLWFGLPVWIRLRE
jgi:hypothetical protein